MSTGRVLVGRYRLVERLGAGGMGSVWRAEDLTLNAPVAIKLIDPRISESSEALTRFKREAQAAAAIRSTHVVQILDYGIDNTSPFIAMELLVGESLGQRLASVGTLTPLQTAHFMGHVGRALAIAHRQGIIHRDLKPENIFLVREEDDEIAKVLDFGVARASSGLVEAAEAVTQAGALLGTPSYMSPEQAVGQVIDHRSDIWSFGAIAFECLLGRKAFDSDSLGGVFHAICVAPLPVPSSLGQVPMGFDEWFAHATARNVESRFWSVRQAIDELRFLCGSTTDDRLSVPSPPNHLARADHGDSLGTAVDSVENTSPPSSRTVPGLPRGPSWRVGLGGGLAVFAAIGGVWTFFSQGGWGEAQPAHSQRMAIPFTAAPAASAPQEPSVEIYPVVSFLPSPTASMEVTRSVSSAERSSGSHPTSRVRGPNSTSPRVVIPASTSSGRAQTGLVFPVSSNSSPHRAGSAPPASAHTPLVRPSSNNVAGF